jgi:LmbE family N-acetylglucosaminyl deacetylase
LVRGAHCRHRLVSALAMGDRGHWVGRRVLVVIAHPDDETLGCGATLAKLHEQGASITVLLALRRTDPRGIEHWDELLRQFEEACSLLGARAAIADPLLGEPQAEPAVHLLHDVILPWVAEAETIFTHWPGDVNQAHRGVSRAVEIATRPFRRHRQVLLFETLTSTEQAYQASFAPNTWFVLEHEHCALAERAMRLYEVEHEVGRRPVDLERRLASRGAEIGVDRAQAFVMARQFG